MKILSQPYLLPFVTLICLCLGLFFFLKPSLAIEMQRKFYVQINWRIEPISMPREIRNTKIMGLFLVIISFLAIAYLFFSLSHN